MATVSGIKAGKAFILIEAIDKTGRVLQLVSARIKKISADITNIGAKLIRFSALGLIPFAAGAKVFTSFDDAMRRVEARSSGTADEMEALREQAKQLGRETSYTAGQIGELQAKLAQKGFNRSQIKDMTADVVNLAKAAGEGTEEDTVLSADLISGTLRAFKMPSSEAGRLADIFTTAVNNSNFSLEGLMDSMSKAAPIASDFNMSVEETVAALASMTNLNIAASDAGTAMKTFFLRMSDPGFTEGFNKQLQDATGKTIQFRDATGNLRSPLALFQEIGEAMDGMGTATRGELLSQLFGVLQAGKAAGAVSGMTDAMDLLNKLQNESQGNAKKTADAMESGLGGAFRKLMSAVEGVGLAIGNAVSGPLMWFSSMIQPIAQRLAEWIEKNERLVSGIFFALIGLAAAGAAMIAFGVTLGAVGTAIGVVGSLISAFAAIMATKLGMVAAAVIAVGASILIFSSDTQAVIGEMVGFLGDMFGRMTQTFRTAMKGIEDAIATGNLELAWNIALKGMEVILAEVTINLLNIWTTFVSEFLKTLYVLQAELAKVFSQASGIAQTFWELLKAKTELAAGKNPLMVVKELVPKLGKISGDTADANAFIDKQALDKIAKQQAAAEAEINKRLKAADLDKAILKEQAALAAEQRKVQQETEDMFDEMLSESATQEAYGLDDLSTESAAGGNNSPMDLLGNFQKGSVEALQQAIKNMQGGEGDKMLATMGGVQSNTAEMLNLMRNGQGFQDLDDA